MQWGIFVISITYMQKDSTDCLPCEKENIKYHGLGGPDEPTSVVSHEMATHHLCTYMKTISPC